MAEKPDYENPPVVEVAAGLQFAPIEGLSGVHIGSYWRSIRTDFPKVEEQPPIAHLIEVFGEEQPNEEPGVRITTRPPLPRTWLVSEDDTALLQVQQDRFHYNWRKLNTETEYPRYKSVKTAFLAHWDTFCRFLSDEGLTKPVVDQCELVYVNIIRKGEGWNTATELNEFFSAFRWGARGDFLPEPENYNWVVRFVWPDGRARMHAGLTPVRLKIDNSEAAQLRLIVRGCPEIINAKSIETWFDTARKWIVNGFVALTDTKADDLWGRKT